MSDSLMSSFDIAVVLLCNSLDRGLVWTFVIGVLGRQDMMMMMIEIKREWFGAYLYSWRKLV